MELCSFSFIRNEGAQYIFTSSWEINATAKMTFRVSMNDFLWGSDSGCDKKRCDNGSKSIMHLSPGALAQSVHYAAFWGLVGLSEFYFAALKQMVMIHFQKSMWKGRFLCLWDCMEWNWALSCFSERKELRFFSMVVQERDLLPFHFKIGKLRHTTVNLHRQRQVAKSQLLSCTIPLWQGEQHCRKHVFFYSSSASHF